MYQILEARELTANIYLMVVEAPRVAKKLSAGTVYYCKNG